MFVLLVNYMFVHVLACVFFHCFSHKIFPTLWRKEGRPVCKLEDMSPCTIEPGPSNSHFK